MDVFSVLKWLLKKRVISPRLAYWSFLELHITCINAMERFAIDFPNGSHSSIRIFNTQKKHSPLHMKDFYAWFSEDSSVKALISKCSPPLWRFCRFSADFQWLSGVKAWYFNPSQAFTERCECFVNACLPMWTLWIQSLHTWKRWKSEENEHCVNGWILFSGNNYVYTRA